MIKGVSLEGILKNINVGNIVKVYPNTIYGLRKEGVFSYVGFVKGVSIDDITLVPYNPDSGCTGGETSFPFNDQYDVPRKLVA